MSQMRTTTLSDNGCSELDALLQTRVEQGDVPGVVAVIANRERTLYRGAFDTPADAIFRIASMTKPITSVAFMMLKEQGLIDLDDEVSRYLPELKGIEVISEFDESDSSYSTRPAAREITLRHLLTQTSGFGYPFSSNVLSKLSGQLPEYHPLLHDPGIRWTYGMGTRVVGRVIEQVTGESLVVFFKSRIFGPLGMSDTGFDLKPEDRTRLASSFNRVNGELVGEQNPASHELRVGGDAGLLGTASDYIRFLQMLLGMGQFDGARILTEQSVSEMTQNQIGNLVVEAQPGAIPERSSAFPLDAGEDKFGLGFQLKEREESGARSPGSYSWAGIRNTHFWGDPKLGIAAVMLTQVLPFYDDRCIQLLTDFENVVYRNLE